MHGRLFPTWGSHNKLGFVLEQILKTFYLLGLLVLLIATFVSSLLFDLSL